MLRRALLTAVLSLVVLVPVACRRSEPKEQKSSTPPPPGITKCNAGILKAVEKQTLPEVLATYYSECAELHSKAPCVDAWRKAATLPTPTKQLALVSRECRAAYCPDLGAYSLDLCKPDFEPTAAAIEKGWGPFMSAVIEREAGEYAPQLYPSMLGFYARTKQLEATWTPPPENDAAPPASASASAAPGGSAAPSPPTASSAAAAPKPAAPKPAAAKPAAPKPAASAP